MPTSAGAGTTEATAAAATAPDGKEKDSNSSKDKKGKTMEVVFGCRCFVAARRRRSGATSDDPLVILE